MAIEQKSKLSHEDKPPKDSIKRSKKSKRKGSKKKRPSDLDLCSSCLVAGGYVGSSHVRNGMRLGGPSHIQIGMRLGGPSHNRDPWALYLYTLSELVAYF
uniref:Uncharacterized protein n=1 Tax=Ananas comosus var. bracteatus TaxID=296719 RepID=A0A6V7QBT5_ANACO|nr:unnamed protein product [Ananas comosus var. bracteatus]